MNLVSAILLVFLVVCAICTALAKNLFHTVLIFMGFSTVMAIVWQMLEAPDLAITEVAVGVGVTSVLYFLTLKKIGELDGGKKE